MRNAAALRRFFCADPVSNPVEQLCNQIQAGLLLPLLLPPSPFLSPLFSFFLLIFLFSFSRLSSLFSFHPVFFPHFPLSTLSCLFLSSSLCSFLFFSFFLMLFLSSSTLFILFLTSGFLLSWFLSVLLLLPLPSLYFFDAVTGRHLATC